MKRNRTFRVDVKEFVTDGAYVIEVWERADGLNRLVESQPIFEKEFNRFIALPSDRLLSYSEAVGMVVADIISRRLRKDE